MVPSCHNDLESLKSAKTFVRLHKLEIQPLKKIVRMVVSYLGEKSDGTILSLQNIHVVNFPRGKTLIYLD